MSKVSNMSSKEVIELSKIANISVLDMKAFIQMCSDKEVTKKYIELYRGVSKGSIEDEGSFIKFYNKYADYIDNEMLILYAAVYYFKYLNEHRSKRVRSSSVRNYNWDPESKEISGFAYDLYIGTITQNLLEVGKGIQRTICWYWYENKNSKGEIDFIESEEIFLHRKINKKDNIRRFDKLDDEFKKIDVNQKNGIEQILNKLELTDICVAFLDRKIGEDIVNYIQENEALKQKLVSDQFALFDLRFDDNPDEYFKIINSIDFESLVGPLKDVLRQHSHYLDIDKLLLLGAYRCKEELENNEGLLDNSQYCAMMQKILEIIKDNIKNYKKSIHYPLRFIENGDYEDRLVDYTVEDLNETLRRFVNGKYITKKETNDIRSKLLDGNMDIDEVDTYYFKLLQLSNEDIENIMGYSLSNFIYGVKKLRYNLDQIIVRQKNNKNFTLKSVIIQLYRDGEIDIAGIINLYSRGAIKIDFFQEYTSELDIAEEVFLRKIHQKYLEFKKAKNKTNKDEIETEIETLVDIYIAINSENTENEKDKEETANKVFNEIEEDFEDDEDIVFYYNKGLLTLEIVADLCGENIIEELYNRNEIGIPDIGELYEIKKIRIQFLENIILSANLSNEELMEYAHKRYISPINIVKIFEERDIYREEAEQLMREGIISKSIYEIIKNRDLRKIEERTKAAFEGLIDLGELEMAVVRGTKLALPDVERKSEIRDTESRNIEGSGKKKEEKLINPFARFEYLKKLKCRRPEKIKYEEMGRINPFYDYNFYLIQEECLGNELRRDAIVIAERFYKDREEKLGFATDNATYVMRYEDYLILQGKQKKLQHEQKREMVKEVPGAIYVVNHRSGSWAVNLIKAIAKAKAGSSFKDLTPNERREETIEWLHTIYNGDEILRILDYAGELDDEERHTYVLNSSGKYVRPNNAPENLADGEYEL